MSGTVDRFEPSVARASLFRRLAPPVVVGLVVVAVWALLGALGAWPSYVLPTPAQVAASLWDLGRSGRLGIAAVASLSRLVRGYGIAIVLGMPLGVAMARIPMVNRALRPYVVGLQALPSICWLPLSLLWFGLNENAILFVVVMGAVLAIAIGAEDALLGADPLLMKMSRTFGVRGPRWVFGMLLPAALPGLLTALKLGWSFAWRALLAAELLYVTGGFGQLLTAGRELMEPAQVIGVMICIVAIGVAIDRLGFRPLQERVRRRWGLAGG